MNIFNITKESKEVINLEETRKKEKIKACIAIAVIVLAIIVTGIISMKYYVEGETNMPFTLSKITIVSTAEGVENEGAQEKWNLSIFQNNDIYFSIEKNDNNKEDEIIEGISIENIQVLENPKVGQIKTYMPNSSDGRLFSYSDEYIVQENKVAYRGANKSNSKTLEIGNQGGTAVIRFANTQIGSYISNEDEEIKHDGSLLQKLNVQNEDVSFKVSFDVVINLKNKSYVSNITLDLPCESDLIEKGICSKEITDKFVFKRVKV